jgi:hypothetical protein
MFPAGWNVQTFWKHSPSVFKRTLSEEMDWKRQFHSMAPKITRPNATGRFFWSYVMNTVHQEKTADL